MIRDTRISGRIDIVINIKKCLFFLNVSVSS